MGRTMAPARSDSSPSTGNVRDARGRVVTQLDPVMMLLFHGDSVIDRAQLDAIVEELEPGVPARHRRLIFFAAVAFMLLLAAGMMLLYYVSNASGRRDIISTLMNPAITGGAIVGGVIVPWIITKQKRMRRASQVMLEHRRCPHCGYSLNGLPSDPADGATVCPECGCAWLLGSGEATDSGPATSAPAPKMILLFLALGLAVLASFGVIFLFL